MAGVQPIGIVIEGKTCLYKRKNSTGKGDQWDKPLPAKEWSHPAWREDIMETTDLITYPTEFSLTEVKSETRSGREWLYIRIRDW
jgi:hypothetical protein